MQVTTAYRQADRDYLQVMTVKELSKMLTTAQVKGRSKATTKLQKIDLLMSEYFGYSENSEGDVYQDIPAPKEAKTSKAPKKEVTRRAIDKKANELGWTVVVEDGIYALKHDRATYGDNMVTAPSLAAIARKLKAVTEEYFVAYHECTSMEFYRKYYKAA